MAELGNLVRLVPLKLDELPSHPALVFEASTTDANGRPNLRPFIKATLEQAVTFVDNILPATFKPGSEKPSLPAVAKVQLLRRDIPGPVLAQIPWLDSKVPRDIPEGISEIGETWFGRKSRHANRQEKGTARFSEFDYGLRTDHSEHEGEYTPDVFDTYKVLDWTVYNDSDEEDPTFGDYKNVTMSGRYCKTSPCRLGLMPQIVYEMCHKLPFPLSTRVFPVLVITAKTGTDDFIVVQIPVNVESLPEAFYSNGRNVRDGDSALKRKRPVLGFVTCEYARLTVFC